MDYPGKQGKRQRAEPPRYRQIDMRDWLVWMDAAREAVAAGREHRRCMAEALTWHALKDRMLAAGLHELRDEPIFRAAKTLYRQVEGETVKAHACTIESQARRECARELMTAHRNEMLTRCSGRALPAMKRLRSAHTDVTLFSIGEQ